MKTKEYTHFTKHFSKTHRSPCSKCIIRATCNKSYRDNTACDKLTEYLAKQMIKAGLFKSCPPKKQKEKKNDTKN